MSDVRLSIDGKFIEGLKKDSGIDNANIIVTEALILLKWVISEIQKGRVLITVDESGNNVIKVVMPIFTSAKKLME